MLCPSFYRAEIVQNPSWLDRLFDRMRRRVIGFLQSRTRPGFCGVMTTDNLRPVSLLIAALGGEGGGVLSDWLIAAANMEGYPAQATSIPGVAQQTGATTYYVEIFPKQWSEFGSLKPVLALSPTQGNLDVMVATEFLRSRACHRKRLDHSGPHAADRLQPSHVFNPRKERDE